jgi:hypothetical protein
MTNNQSNELREEIATLSVDGHQLQNYLGSQHVDMLVEYIQDRERQAEGRGRVAVLSSLKEWADDTELTYNNFLRDELEKLEQLKGDKS